MQLRVSERGGRQKQSLKEYEQKYFKCDENYKLTNLRGLTSPRSLEKMTAQQIIIKLLKISNKEEILQADGKNKKKTH